MSKIEVINEILNIYDENNSLKNEIDFLERKQKIKKPKEEQDNLKEKIYKIGLEKLFEDCFSGTYINRWNKNEEFRDLEDWSNSNIDLDGIYGTISQHEFKELFGDRIKTAYDKAIEKALEKEKESD